jgi:hypothetical protein
MIVQEVQQEVTLLFLVAHNAAGELRIDKQRLLACSGVRAYDRVNGSNGLAADDASPVLAVLGLFMACGGSGQ